MYAFCIVVSAFNDYRPTETYELCKRLCNNSSDGLN